MVKSSQVYVVGLGMISSIGNDTDQAIQSFRNHRSGIRPIRHLVTRHRNEFPCGEVQLSNEELASKLGLKKNLSRTILLSHHAALEAIRGFTIEQFNQFRFGFISASTVGGMDKTEDFFNEFMKDPGSGDIRDASNHDCGKPTDVVAKSLGMRGFVTTISTACSSSANTIMLAARLIRSGKLDVVLAGGVDALTRFTLNGFNTLMIVDNKQTRPLDNTRTGLNLGEGAAYLLMMSESMATQFKAAPYCSLTGFGNANDSFHQTALSDYGDGPWFSMTKALSIANMVPEQIDYINMHGTGTQNNDQSEGRAIERLFGAQIPKLSSTKSFTGHTLGASGAVEAVLSALAIRYGFIYPNFSFSERMDGMSIQPEVHFQEGARIENVLSNSFGFGGNCTSLVFSR